jgi:hypothetical protein
MDPRLRESNIWHTKKKIVVFRPDARHDRQGFAPYWPGVPGGSTISTSPGGGAAGVERVCAGSNFGVSVPIRAW